MKIGIIGRAGHGKDTLGEQFVLLGAERVAFADPIKEMVHVGLGIEREVLWGPAEVKERTLPEFGVSARHLLQTLGTEWGRVHVHQDLWVRLALARHIPSREAAGQRDFIVTDVRFLNEARLLREAGFTLIRVVRPGYGPAPVRWWERILHRVSFGWLGRTEHASEDELATIDHDFVIINDAGIEDLQREARDAWECLRFSEVSGQAAAQARSYAGGPDAG
jgi:dephospho-CoA kinase